MIMKILGPVQRILVMRYEAKRQFFKDLIRKLKNLNDVSFLLGSRNQLHLIYILLKSLRMTNLSLSY